MSRAPAVGAVTDLQPARILRADPTPIARPAQGAVRAHAVIRTRVENTAAVRHLLTGGDALPPGNSLQSLVSRLAPRTGHTLARVAFAHDGSGGDPDLRWTCECDRTGWGWREANLHYRETGDADAWRTREPLRIRRHHPTGPHGLSVTLQDHPDGTTTRMVVLCDCGWYVVGSPGHAVQAAAWALAHRTVADHDPRPEVRWRDEHQTLTRLAILSLQEHELADLPRTVSETLVLEAGLLVDEIRTNPGTFTTPGAHPDDLSHHAAITAHLRRLRDDGLYPLDPGDPRSLADAAVAVLAELPVGWREIGYTTDLGAVLGVDPVPIAEDEHAAYPGARTITVPADSPHAFLVGTTIIVGPGRLAVADRTDDLADLDRFANTAAGIRARLAEIDAADRAGHVGLDQDSNGATWRAEHATEGDHHG